MKVNLNLEFDMPEEREDFNRYAKALDLALALSETRQRVFRPARKHGYSSKKIQDLLDLMQEKGISGEDLIELLEDEFNSICQEYSVSEFS
jgi:hypothetical protein